MNPTPIPPPNVLAREELTTEILLIRHGRAADIVPGSEESVDPPLSGEGRAQAEALARRLGGKQIDAVYASTLARAIQTAEPLAAARGLSVEQVHDLREVELGQWERGEFRRLAAARDPQWLAFARAGRWDLIPGSEGDGPFRRRVRTTIDEIVDRHDGQTAAVVVHGGVINGYVAEVFGSERSFLIAVENTSVTVVRGGAGQRVVITVNDTHHLYDPVMAGPSSG